MTIVGAAYVLLTFFALSFRGINILEFASKWTNETPHVVTVGGHGNIHHFLAPLGVENMLLPFSALMLAALAVWIYKFRKTDFWVQLGVAAIIARFWAYHRLYDDILMIIPMAAVLRLLRNGGLSENGRAAASNKAGIRQPAHGVVPE